MNVSLGRALRDFAENELDLNLSTGEETARNSIKQLIYLGAPRDFAEHELKFSLCVGEGNVRISIKKMMGSEGGCTARLHRK